MCEKNDLPSSMEKFTKMLKCFSWRLGNEHHIHGRKCGEEGRCKEHVDSDAPPIFAYDPHFIGCVGGGHQVRIDAFVEVVPRKLNLLELSHLILKMIEGYSPAWCSKGVADASLLWKMGSLK